MAAIIGITTHGRVEKTLRCDHYDEYFTTPAQYVDAVRRAGGIPVLLPPGGEDQDWGPVLDMLSGLIVTGGADVDPARYGGDGDHPALWPLDLERERAEFALLPQVLARPELPSLWICRGMQVLNVSAGGTLYEHIPDVRDAFIHQDARGLWVLQAVDVCQESRIAGIMGSRQISPTSGHHQGLRDIGAGLRVAALAPDGIVEAIEHTEHPFCIGVQWHPEVTAAGDPQQQALFDALVAAAGGGDDQLT
jgi:putative glutamine amidotransferase